MKANPESQPPRDTQKTHVVRYHQAFKKLAVALEHVLILRPLA
jgi:hypothetical protein